jgi:CubicO group peptidase (beta-lactamase class C family)
MGMHMPILKGTNKDTIIIRKALAHFGQLKAWINYYPTTFDSITKKPLPMYYRDKPSKDYNIKIAEKLYLRSDYQDTIYRHIADSDLRETSGYKYSGLIFYLMKNYIHKTYNEQMNVLDDKWFYKPLGANTLTYKPLEKFSKERIVPTEKDTYFRNQIIQGTVHDMGAAMMDGVSGNAGLFSNANDLAKMMQMYLQGGFYGGKRYFKSKTIDKFNTRYYEKDSVRRGLGFDKPQLNPEVLATCGCVSDKSFGHAGFTGTFVWADPETELVYIFLSNRTYPTMDNRKLYEEDIRTKAQQIIVDAIIEE